MKKIFALLIIFFCINNFAKAQGFQRVLGEVNTSWNILVTTKSGGKTIVIEDTKRDTIFSDSSKVYNILHISILDTNILMREDTVQGKVWLRKFSASDSAEYLIMDLGMYKGDSALVYYNVNSGSVYAEVDSIYKKSGKLTIRFAHSQKESEYKEPLRYIEGVGPTYGIIASFPAIFYKENYITQTLLCMEKDNIMQFKLPAATSCHVNYSGIKYADKNNINVSIYPNPASDLINFKFEKMTEAKIVIMDTFGKEISKRFSHNAHMEISTSALPNGIYFYKIIENNSVTANGKLVVNH